MNIRILKSEEKKITHNPTMKRSRSDHYPILNISSRTYKVFKLYMNNRGIKEDV